MRIRALTATVVAALTAAVPAAPAHAWPPDDGTYDGGCFLAAVSDTTQVLLPPTRWRGVLGAGVVAWSPTLAHNPVHAYVTCDVRVNGVLADTTTARSGPVVAHADTVLFDAGQTDLVEVCEDVTTWDAHGQIKRSYVCDAVSDTVAPPQEVVDAVCPAAGAAVCAVADATRVRWLIHWPQP